MTVRMAGQSFSCEFYANSRGQEMSSSQHHRPDILLPQSYGTARQSSSRRIGACHEAKQPNDCRVFRGGGGLVTPSDFRSTQLDGGFLPPGGAAPVTGFGSDYEHRNNFQVPFYPLQYGTYLDRGGLSTQEASYSNHVRAVDYADYGGERSYGLQDYGYGIQRMSHYGNENNFYRNSSYMGQNISRKDCMYQVENHNYLRPVEQHYVGGQGGVDEHNYRWQGNCTQVSSSDRFEYLESRTVREQYTNQKWCSGSTNHESRQTHACLGPASTPYCFNHDVINHENSRGSYSSQVASSPCFRPARSIDTRGQEDHVTQGRASRDLRCKQNGDSCDYDEPLDLRRVNQDYTNHDCGDYGENLRYVNQATRPREGFFSGNREAIQLNGFTSIPINQGSDFYNITQDPYYVFGVPKTISTGDVQGTGCFSYPDHGGLHDLDFENDDRNSTESSPLSASGPRPSTGDAAYPRMLHAKTASGSGHQNASAVLSYNTQSPIAPHPPPLPHDNFPGIHQNLSPFSPFGLFLSSFASTFSSPMRFVETSDVTDQVCGTFSQRTVQDGGALRTTVSGSRVSGTEDQCTSLVVDSSTPRTTRASENSFGTQVPNVVTVPALVQNTSVPMTDTGSTVVSCASAAAGAKVPGKATQAPGKGTQVPGKGTKVPGKCRSNKARNYGRSQNSGSHSSSTDDVLLLKRFRPILPKPVTETSRKEPETGEVQRTRRDWKWRCCSLEFGDYNLYRIHMGSVHGICENPSTGNRKRSRRKTDANAKCKKPRIRKKKKEEKEVEEEEEEEEEDEEEKRYCQCSSIRNEDEEEEDEEEAEEEEEKEEAEKGYCQCSCTPDPSPAVADPTSASASPVTVETASNALEDFGDKNVPESDLGAQEQSSAPRSSVPEGHNSTSSTPPPPPTPRLHSTVHRLPEMLYHRSLLWTPNGSSFIDLN